MLSLSIDAATRFSGLALLDGSTLLAEYLVQSPLSHSERLLPAIDKIFGDCARSVSDLEAIIVSKGPGSFTGLRIAMSLAKGMAQALDIPLLGVSSLDHWACSLAFAIAEKTPILVLLDAGRGEYYSALYIQKDGELMRLEPELPRPLDALREIVSATNSRTSEEGQHEPNRESSGDDTAKQVRSIPKVHLTGDVFPKKRAEITAAFGDEVILLSEHCSLPRPSALALLGQRRFDRGERDDLFTLVPQYLRLSEAERKRLAPMTNN